MANNQAENKRLVKTAGGHTVLRRTEPFAEGSSARDNLVFQNIRMKASIFHESRLRSLDAIHLASYFRIRATESQHRNPYMP